MADIKFKLEEGVLGDFGKGLAKVVLSPLTGGYEGSSKMVDNISTKLRKRGYYAAEQEVEKNTKNIINGYVNILKKIEIMGKVGFAKENFNSDELGVLEDSISKFINDHIKDYRAKVKRALDYESTPPEPDFSKTSIIRQYSNELAKEIKNKYKSDEDMYYRLNKWYKEGMKVAGTTLPRLVYSGLDSLAGQWAQLENKAKEMKND